MIRRPLRILQVEDSVEDAELQTLQLRRAGYDVLATRVESASEMRQALRSQEFDVVVSDYSLPQFDGVQALQLLKAAQIDIPFLIVSGAISPESAVQLMREGAHDYLLKDDLTRLIPAIEREIAEAAGRRERRRIEKELQLAYARSESDRRKFKELVDWLDHAIVWECDAVSGKFHLVSHRTVDQLKFEEEDWYREPRFLINRTHPEDRPLIASIVARVQAGENDLSCAHRVIKGDGTVQWFKTGMHIRVSEEGSVISGITVDIQALKDAEDRTRRAQDELRKNAETQRFLAEAGAMLSASLDQKAILERVTHLCVPRLADWCVVELLTKDRSIEQVAAAHVDRSKERLVVELGRRLPYDPRLLHGVPQVIRSGMPEVHPDVAATEWVAENLGAEYPQILRELGAKSYMCVPLTGRSGVIGVITFVLSERDRRYSAADLDQAVDLTRRTAVALENAKLYAETKAAVSTREELLAVVSHDLRNPLGAILMNASMLLRSNPEGDSLPVPRRMIETMRRSGERMNEIIEDLLSLAKLEAGHLEIQASRCTLGELVQDVFEMFRSQAEQKSVQLSSKVEAPGTQLVCDVAKAGRVLSNLVGNAIKFTPEGGVVTLRANPRGEEVLFCVKDTGPGIAEHHIPHVFDRYWQAQKTAHKGTGLGLSIAKGFVQAHGGRIWVKSAFGQGSEFYFTLPLDPRGGAQDRGRLRIAG